MAKLNAMKGGELDKKLADLREDIRTLHFKTEGAKSKNVKEAQNLKKEIARVMTLMNQRKQNA